MAFLPPVLPITCNVCEGPFSTVRLADVPCALYSINRDKDFSDASALTVSPAVSHVVFAPRVDVRDPTDGAIYFDSIEIPPGSGSHYNVYAVVDCWRGFPNEYRMARVIHRTQPSSTPRP